MADKQYFATYAFGEVVTGDESKNLIGNESAIGSKIDLSFETDDDGHGTVRALSSRGYPLGAFSAHDSNMFRRMADAGMEHLAYLSSVIYAESNGMFWGEYLVMFYRPEDADAMAAFGTHLAGKIAKGGHPNPELDAASLEALRESGGSWCDVEDIERSKLKKGVVYFKKKRSLTDGLVDQAVRGRKGCSVAATVFWIVLAAVIVYFAWRLFLA